jgi:C4-dicarboxylate transporter, DctM subunit
MNEPNMTLLVFGGLVAALALGIPVGYALGVATLLGLLLTPVPIVFLAQTFYTGVGLFPLIAIPGFFLAGALMERSGLTDRIVRVVYLVAGNIPGGLAVVTILSSTFFASLSGSGPATTAAVGSVMIPTMNRGRYPAPFSAAVASTGGTLGILIPPSNPMIVYGVVANLSVAGLFLAGIVPGLLLSLLLSGYCLLIGWRRGFQASGQRFAWREFGRAVWDGKTALAMPVIVLGSIYGGLATPTEASMLAVVYTFLTGVLAKRLSLRDVGESLVLAGRLTGAVLIIMGPAMAFGKLLTLYEIPKQISAVILNVSDNRVLVLAMISVFLVFVGTFMETLSTIVLLTPIFLPVMQDVGVDPVHFGILFVVLSEVGFLTPPLGVNLYVASAVSGLRIETISRAVVPFILVLLGFTAVLILFPSISTWGYYRLATG